MKENLVQYNKNISLTPDERRERAAKAGIASGEARRKKRMMKDILSDFMEADITEPELIEMLKDVGLPATQESAICFAAVKKAQRGDIEAARFVRDTLGEKPREELNVAATPLRPSEIDLSKLSNEELYQLMEQYELEEENLI